MGPPVAAFFDVDNTIVRGATMFHLARGLFRRHVLDTRDLVRMTHREATFRIRGEDHEHIEEARIAGLDLIRGQSLAQMYALSEQVFEERIRRRLWGEVVDELAEHQAAGTEVWLVSATPIELADVIAAHLGIAGALGTVAEALDGVYTGRLVDGMLHGTAKAAAVRSLADQRGLALADSHGYSDSVNDLPLLEAVGHPHAVNPDAALREVALERDWPILDVRRDRRRRVLRHAAGVGAAAGVVGSAAVAAGRRVASG